MVGRGLDSSMLERRLSSADGHAPLQTDGPSEEQPNDAYRARAAQRCRKRLPIDAELRAAAPDFGILKRLTSGDRCCSELLRDVCQAYAERVAFKISPKGEPAFEPVTYQQVWERTVALATGLQKQGLAAKGAFVAILGFASLDWVVADFANSYNGSTTVPVPSNVRAEDIVAIMEEAECSCLVISVAEVKTLLPLLGDLKTVRSIVVMDLAGMAPERVQEGLKKLEASAPQGMRVATLEAVEAAGAKEEPAPMVVVPPGENPLVSLFYTSGSTGLPKGAEYRDSVWRQMWRAQLEEEDDTPSICLCFLPMNHIMGRWNMLRPFCRGGINYITRSADLTTLFEDFELARPTALMLIPRISKMLQDHFEEGLAKAQARHGGEDATAQKQAAIEDFRERQMGGRIYTAMTGSAPTAPSLLDNLRALLLTPISEGYGSTEFGVATRDNRITPNVTMWRLRDVPELGYTTADRPFPRGELLVATESMITGYYKHEKATAETFVDGFMETGDIFEQRGPDHIVWIDRKKNILKLSQGEFVSVSRLEADYAGNSGLISQIYIYGNGLRSYLLAVVVPSDELRQKYAADPASKELKATLRTDLDDVARTKALQGYEIPRDFLVEMAPFSKANHLITDSGKPARGKLKAAYGPKLEALYEAMEAKAQERMAAVRAKAAEGRAGTVEEQVKQAAMLVLGVDEADIDPRASFAQLGGDSLAAIQFQRQLEELTGAALPVSFVLDHSQSLTAIVAKCEELLGGAGKDVVTFKSVHPGHSGDEADLIQASDLRLEKFVPNLAELAATAAAAEQLPAAPTRVLLTGANGFLGRFLLLQLLRQVADRPGGYVVAVVRGTSDEAALSRLRHGYDSGDPQMLAQFSQLAEGRLRVYSGDLARPNLGLKPEVYKRLAAELDTVFHNGALVNHAFSYEQLFEPNVLGTVEVMKLALLTRKKALTFISSVGVAAGVGPHHEGPILESEDGAKLTPAFPGGGGYAVGYGCSKWACEVLLREAADSLGLPVSVFRCGMILASSKYVGQINPTDFFTRLMAGLVYLRIAPQTFYEHPAGPENHFDGMPIDYVADGITGIASAHRAGFALFHVVNPHWGDGIGFDRIVEWMETGGYPIKRIPEYGAWFAAFKQGLQGLDPKLQQQSPLPIIHQWTKPVGAQATKLDATQMRAGVRKYTQWPDVPHLDEAFIHTNLRHMQAVHIIEPPAAAGQNGHAANGHVANGHTANGHA